MNRLMRQLRTIAASPSAAAVLLLLLLSAFPAAASFCNNGTEPCQVDNPLSKCFKPKKKKPTCEPLYCDKCTKSPCYTGSGVYTTQAVDLEIPTAGFPISVSRTYETSQHIDGATGYGWTSSLSARIYYAVFLKAAPSTYSREADVRMPNGSEYRFVENANGTFTPPQGRFDTLVRNGDGTWDLWLQRSRSHMHFDSTGKLLTIVDDFGNTQTWTYTGDRVTRIEDSSGSGRYVDITYGADGRISDVTDLTGRNVHYTYNTAGMLTAVQNPALQSTQYTYVAGVYNPLLSAITDHWGRNVTTVTYDLQDRTTSYTEKGETYTYTYAYNGVGTTTAKSDSSGNIWVYPFGTDGLVSDSIAPGGATTSHVDYDANGLPLLVTDALGVKTSFTYNARGNPVTRIVDYQGASAVEWRYVYDANFPDSILTVTPYVPGTNNVHSGWQGRKYDYYPPGSTAPGARHHVYEVDNDGVTSRVIRTYTYDSHGRPLTETTATGAVHSLTYDSAGNVQRDERPANNDAGVRPATTYTYDALGRILTMTDPLGHVRSYTWDVLGRITSRTDPLPSPASTLTFTTSIHYDEYEAATQSLANRVVDVNGATFTLSLDVYGQIVRQTDASGAATRWVWSKGLLTSQIDANNYATAYTYDSRRRLDTVTYPDSTYEQYTYSADDNIVTFRDRAARTVTYGYDRIKRMTSAAYTGGGTTTWTFDGQHVVHVEDTRTSPAETIDRTWSASFRLTSETQSTRGTVQWTYDSDGRTATESVAGGATTSYGYYPDGSTRTLTWSLVSGTFLHTYDLAGRRAAIEFPNGQTRTYAYDDQDRITSVANTHPSTGTLASFSYGYDVNAFTAQANRLGLLTTTTASMPALSIVNGVTKYDYDTRQMLIRADYPTAAPYNGLTSAWTFDAARNRTSTTTNGVTANSTYAKFGTNPLNSSRLLSDGGNDYTYDASGNTLTRTGTRGNYTFGWDAADRLISVNGSESGGHRYDVIHRRVATNTPSGTTTYLYSGLDPIVEAGASSAQYLFTGQNDQPLAMFRGGQVYYYSVDGQGSVVAVNDAAGSVANSYAYDAWGTSIARNETVANPFGFTARPFSLAGLADHRFRFYEAATGTFRSVDPLVSVSGRAVATRRTPFAPLFAAYGYGQGRPTMLVDPFGLNDCEAGCYEQYKEDMTAAALAFATEMALAAIGLKSCLAGSVAILNPLPCLLAYAAVVAGIYAQLAFLQWLANKHLRECLQGCTPECPPMMPSHPSGGGAPPGMPGPGSKAMAPA